MRRFAPLIAAPLLVACVGSGTTPIVSDGPLRSARPAPATETFRRPEIDRETGLESVLGQRAAALLSRYGKARIDLKEGDARKLQFAGERCILDVFLYPLEAGAEPVSTHVEARERKGGGNTSKSRCLSEIARR